MPNEKTHQFPPNINTIKKTNSKMKIILLLLIEFMLIAAIGCKKDGPKSDTIKDIDGNTYKIVSIGTQIWMAENLKTTKYNDGSYISDGTRKRNYSNENNPKYYFNYDDDIQNVTTYGRLYTWFVANDSIGICPKGWHLPSDAEWNILINYLGGEKSAGGKMRLSGSFWIDMDKTIDTKSDNSCGFSILPGGMRDCYTSFHFLGFDGSFWTATLRDNSSAWYRFVNSFSGGLAKFYLNSVYP